MRTFKYDIQDTGGHVTTGVIQAQDMSEAVRRLRAQGGYLLNVAPVVVSASGILNSFKKIKGGKPAWRTAAIIGFASSTHPARSQKTVVIRSSSPTISRVALAKTVAFE